MKLRSTILAVALALSVASQARAAGMLDFGVIAPTTGTISYAGGSAPLVGTNISVDNVVGLGTPANNFIARNCISCVLNFTTGAASPANSWTFSAGGTITIVGGVDLNNDGDATDAGDIAVGTTLLSGSFVGNPAAMVTTTSGVLRIAGAGFLDVKDEDLAAFYGLPGGATVPYQGGFNISFAAAGTPGSAFTSSTVLSGDIVNSQVDLPSSLLLLGSGLVGFAFLTARTRRN